MEQKSTSFSHAKPYNKLDTPPAFKNEAFKTALKNEWIGSEPFEVGIKHISRVPAVTTLRCNSLLFAPEVCMKEIQALFPPPNFAVQLHPLLPDIIEIRKAPKDLVPLVEHPNKLLVDQRCACYVLRGASIFCKGVMASTHFSPSDNISVYYSNKQYTTGTIITEEEFSKISNTLIWIGNGIAKMSRKDALCAAEGVAVEMVELYAENSFPFSFAGLDPAKYYPQNIGSALVAHLLEIKEEDVILDACAAPGGKTTHLAILAKDKAKIIAVDKSADRLKMLEKAAEEQSIKCIACFKGDAGEMLKLGTVLENNKGKKVKLEEEMFDKIVVDPPCSSLGVKPFLGTITNTISEINHLAKIQRQILYNASKLLKKGGLLAYSTCTITPWENEKNVHYALTELGLTLVSPKIQLVPPVLNKVLPEKETKCVQRIELSSEYNGFFVAIFTK